MTDLTLYYAPRTRAFTALWLMEELGVDYRLESFDIRSGRHKQPDYLALNPMGKVPLVVHDGVPVSETAAIAIYLADRFPESGVGVAHDDPDRPAYLRWHFFAAAIIEPAYMQKFAGWEADPSQAAWGSFEAMVEVATAGVSAGEWLLGDRFSTADVVVGSGLDFGVKFGILPREGAIFDYVQRVTARPAYRRATATESKEGERFPPG